MTTYFQEPDLAMTVKQVQANNSPPHRHRHFEIVSVLSGRGKHVINDNQFDYTTGDLFLLTPQDLHTFKVAIPSEFCIVDFTGSFFAFIGSPEKDQFQLTPLFEQMEYVFHNHHRIKGNIIADEEDRVWAQLLIKRLLSEKEQEDYGKENISKNIVFLLLQLIARHIRRQLIFPLKTPRAERMVQGIVNFVHQHIYDKEALKVKNIAHHFHKSKDHISLYFKQQTGTTLKEYISAYKLQLVKTRLLYSELSISGVAAELDFTDESHLNKLFKRRFGVTASAYRKKAKGA
ncbi:MAG TPA: AraC family transcriptional regulator [Puia sp.]|uniref:helix-turn-helix domain-containing protein n=1 Tax=Puia sp. TaxID=2045100 RepID=UPI002B6D8CDD|nr:AraC family transcriptional regulator [Puia sp.]HVU94681.1 AraC family transcriptional regulator [Puia sp.]